MTRTGCALIWAALTLFPSAAWGHTPILSCFEDGARCECKGIFSDMSVASGADIRVTDGSGKTIVKGVTDGEGEFSFPIPRGEYKVFMNAGPGHAADPWVPIEE
jgi:hypothetical protein